MGAFDINQPSTVHPAGLAPAKPLWKSGVLLLHHGRTRTSGSGGNRTHVNLLKRQAPSQRRTHFRSTSGPHGSRTRNLPLDRRSLYRLSFWTVHNQQVAEESNPAGRTVGFGDRVRSQTRSPPVNSVPRAGVEPDLSGLKDHRPHRKSNGAYLSVITNAHQKKNRPGVACTPGRRGCHYMARQGLPTRIAHTAQMHFAFNSRQGIKTQT